MDVSRWAPAVGGRRDDAAMSEIRDIEAYMRARAAHPAGKAKECTVQTPDERPREQDLKKAV